MSPVFFTSSSLFLLPLLILEMERRQRGSSWRKEGAERQRVGDLGGGGGRGEREHLAEVRDLRNAFSKLKLKIRLFVNIFKMVVF